MFFWNVIFSERIGAKNVFLWPFIPLDPLACGVRMRSWQVYEGSHASGSLRPSLYTGLNAF